MSKFRVFTFSHPTIGVLNFTVADWTNEEAWGSRRDIRPGPLAEFKVNQRHNEVDQCELADMLCSMLNKREEARQAIKLEMPE